MSLVTAQLIGKSQNVCLSAALLMSLHTYSCDSALEVWRFGRNVRAQQKCQVLQKCEVTLRLSLWKHRLPVSIICTASCFSHASGTAPGIAMWVCWLVLCQATALVQTAIYCIISWLIAMKSCRDIHGSKMMYANDFGDPLTDFVSLHGITTPIMQLYVQLADCPTRCSQLTWPI